MKDRISIIQMCENNGRLRKLPVGLIIFATRKICFILLRDGSGTTQLVVENSDEIQK